jgi:hypothetical protein
VNAAPSFGALHPAIEPHALAVQILSEHRFRIRVAPKPQKTWMDAAWQWLADRFASLVDAFSRSVHLGRAASVTIGDVAIALAVGIVIFACVRLAMQAAREQSASAAGVSLEARETARALYDRAVAAAAERRYAAAIAFLFRATLAALDMRHTIDDAPSHTVNECKSEVRARAAQLYAPFEHLARAFTAVAYAQSPASESEWSAARSIYETYFARRLDEP